MKKKSEIVRLVIGAAGGQIKLAKALGVTPGAVSQWVGIPAGRVIAIESVTGIPRDILRPDIYDKSEE